LVKELIGEGRSGYGNDHYNGTQREVGQPSLHSGFIQMTSRRELKAVQLVIAEDTKLYRPISDHHSLSGREIKALWRNLRSKEGE
jgi:hypothetical protein